MYPHNLRPLAFAAILLLVGCAGNQQKFDAQFQELESRVGLLEKPKRPRPFRSLNLVPSDHLADVERWVEVLKIRMDRGDVSGLTYSRAEMFLNKLRFLRNDLSREDYEGRLKKHREWLDDVKSANRQAGLGEKLSSEDQLAAFQADDAIRAFSHASPMIRRAFGTPSNFLRMVVTGYPPVYRPRAVEFQDIVTFRGAPTQRVFLVGPDGQSVIALYVMELQAGGVWKIDGCYLVKAEDSMV